MWCGDVVTMCRQDGQAVCFTVLDVWACTTHSHLSPRAPRSSFAPAIPSRQDFEVEIKPMPGCLRHSLPHMLKEVEEAWQFGVRTFVVFPKVWWNTEWWNNPRAPTKWKDASMTRHDNPPRPPHKRLCFLSCSYDTCAYRCCAACRLLFGWLQCMK